MDHGYYQISKAQSIPALSSRVVKVNVITDMDNIPPKDTVVSACVGSETKPLITTDPGLSVIDDKGQMLVLVKNCAPIDIVLDEMNS